MSSRRQGLGEVVSTNPQTVERDIANGWWIFCEIRMTFLVKFYQCLLSVQLTLKTLKICLVGPSDSGKSSLVCVLFCLSSINTMPPFRRRRPLNWVWSLTQPSWCLLTKWTRISTATWPGQNIFSKVEWWHCPENTSMHTSCRAMLVSEF